MKLDQKCIVITGGTSGVGRCLVEQLYEHNQLIVISRNEQKLQSLADQFQGIEVYAADLSRLEDVEAVADAIVKSHSSVDVLINNAAVQYSPKFLDQSFRYESIQREITTNFTSICALTYLLLPALIHQQPAVVLNVNSGLALTPKSSSAVYCASKAALDNFTQSLRYQLSETNICVQQVFLALVETSMTRGRGGDKLSAREAAEEILRCIEQGYLDYDVGKVKLLRFLLRWMPSVAKRMMKRH